MRTFQAAVLILVFTLLGCAGSSVDHYEQALGIERELLRRNPTITYSHPGYVSVLRELAKVPRGHDDRPRAGTLTQRISDGRRIALNDKVPQVDHLPRRLRGTEAPRPMPAAGSSRPVGLRSTTPAARRSLERAAAGALGELTQAQLGQLDITLYTTSWCGYCRKARRYFNDRGIPFVEKDVERDPLGGDEFRRLSRGRGGVPLILVNGQTLRGFSQPALEAAIARAVAL
jgi:glutaredoxin